MQRLAAIEIEDLTVCSGEKRIISHFSLRVLSGHKLVLSGKSGSGKSTILRCLLGFVEPEQGTVRIDGQPLTADSVWELRKRLAYVAQEPELGIGLVSEMFEQTFAYRSNEHLRQNLSRVPNLLDRFDLASDLMRSDISTLSGGEKQRLALISAILLDRRIFLLDEPVSALDEKSKALVVSFFRERDDLTVLSVSHDREVFSFADSIVNLPESWEGDSGEH